MWRPLGLVLLVWGTLAAAPSRRAEATEFTPPPDISSRKVELSWAPDADDPVFRGNTVLEQVSSFSNVHGAGHAVRVMALQSGTTNAFSFAEGEDSVVEFNFTTGAMIGLFPLPPGGKLTDLHVHTTGRWLVGAFDDGKVALWDTELPNQPPTFIRDVSTRGLRAVRFLPNLTDPNDLRFVTAGLDDTVRVFASPDQVDARLIVRDGATYALAVLPIPSGVWIATGGAGRSIRLWDLAAPVSPRLLLEGHAGPVAEFAFTSDLQRLASADSTGQVRIWGIANGNLISSTETGQLDAPPRLGYSAPDGQILFLALRDGRMELRSGITGAFFRTEQFTDKDITAFLIHTDGRRVLIGDEDGQIRLIRGGRCVPSSLDPVCFGGYKIWRSPTRNEADAVLLRAYNFDDSTWTFVGEAREFADPDSMIARRNPVDPAQDEPSEPALLAGPHNGLPYFYSVTRFNRHYLNGAVFDELLNSIDEGFYRDPGTTLPTAIVTQARARADNPLLDDVYVVPNPYEEGKVQWERFTSPHLEFRNLPGEAKISIYSVAGDLVRVLQHGKDKYGESRDASEWDLKNSSGRNVATGVYVYQVETPSGEVVQGYLTLVR